MHRELFAPTYTLGIINATITSNHCKHKFKARMLFHKSSMYPSRRLRMPASMRVIILTPRRKKQQYVTRSQGGYKM